MKSSLSILSILAILNLSPIVAEPPQYGKWGFDIVGSDSSILPGDDFFLYANGAWIENAEIPSDKYSYSPMAAQRDLIQDRLHEILVQTQVNPVTDIEKKIGTFYRSFMNEKRIEELDFLAIKPQLDMVRAANSHKAIGKLMGRHNSDLYGSIFRLFIDIDSKNPKLNSVHVCQGGLGLPDRDYYLKPEFSGQKAKYQAYVEQLLTRIFWPEPAKSAEDIVTFESRIAEACWTRVQESDPVATYNPIQVAELETLVPQFAWKEYLESSNLGHTSRLILIQKSAFMTMAAIYAQTPLNILKAWLAFTVVDNAAPYLSKPFADAHYELYNRVLLGQAEQEMRWKRAVRVVAGGDFGSGNCFGNMGWAVGELYTTKFFSPKAKEEIEKLAINIKIAFRKRLEKLDWMSDESKLEALKKLDKSSIKVGYPDKPNRDYSQLALHEDDLIGNIIRAASLEWSFSLMRLQRPVDPDIWWITPQTNNAYHGALDENVFPAGFLLAPTFDPNADPAINYGAIGAIIGHELTHGFDDQGCQFDADGVLRTWWTQKDAETFKDRALNLGAQYATYEPLSGLFVNSELTMSENIADLGGLILALDAYHESLNGKEAPIIDGFTGDQRLFLGWAQVNRDKISDDALRRALIIDSHSPKMFRVNGVVRNIDSWYEAFQVQPGHKLYLPPGRRVKIW